MNVEQKAAWSVTWTTGLASRAGSWAFRQRSWLPIPFIFTLLLIDRGRIDTPAAGTAAIALIAAGLALRLWSVRHIGTISRTRMNRLGPLMTSGPYAVVRNPLYIANWSLWTGFVLQSGLLWMLPVAWGVFAVQYGAIVSWEEQVLRRQFGRAYAVYAQVVPRWVPLRLSAGPNSSARHGWGTVFFSERGTLAAVCGVRVLMSLKHWLVLYQ